MRPVPELLCPAGDFSRLTTALAYGADAVYLGGPTLSLRAAAKGFTLGELPRAVALAASRQAKVYYCLNAFVQPQDMQALARTLTDLAALPKASRPHALIVADPGVIRLARRLAPDYPLHLSTQANTGNAEAARFFADQGVARVNLARELSLAAIRDIVREAKDIAFEVFVHGARCLAVSGQCLLSMDLTGRGANQGGCAHPCRYDYRPVAVLLEEKTRPGKALWEVKAADEAGYSHILAASDLCLAPFLPALARTGLAGLKIEGRARSRGYLALVTDVYATALADLAQGKFRPRLYLDELMGLGGRELSTGFFLPRRLFFRPDGPTRPVLAEVGEQDGGGFALSVKAGFDASQPVRLLLPGLNRPVILPGRYGIEDEHGWRVGTAHPGRNLRLVCDHPLLAPGVFIQSCVPADLVDKGGGGV